LPNLNHAFVSGVADDADATTVSPSNWNADILTSLPTTDVGDWFTRLVLPSTDRLTAAGTGRARVTEYPVAFMGTYSITPTIVNDNYLLQYKRASLTGTARASVFGNGELFLFDLAPVGRLVLAGRGGT
jgi:hypothetical protein